MVGLSGVPWMARVRASVSFSFTARMYMTFFMQSKIHCVRCRNSKPKMSSVPLGRTWNVMGCVTS